MKYNIPDPWLSAESELASEFRRNQQLRSSATKVKLEKADVLRQKQTIKQIREQSAELRKLTKEFNNYVKQGGQVADVIKNKKLPSGINVGLGQNLTRIINVASTVASFAGVGLSLGNLYVAEARNNVNESKFDLYGRELGNQLALIIKSSKLLKTVEKKVTANSVAIDVFAGAIGEMRMFVNREMTNFKISLDGGKLDQARIEGAQASLSNRLSGLGNQLNQVTGDAANVKNEVSLIRDLVNRLNYRTTSPKDPRVDKIQQMTTQNSKDINNLKKSIGNVPGNILSQIQNAVKLAQSASNKVINLQKNLPLTIQTTVTKIIDGKLIEIKKDIEIIRKQGDEKINKKDFPENIRQSIPLIIQNLQPIINIELAPVKAGYDALKGAYEGLRTKLSEQNTTIQDQNRKIEKTNLDIEKQNTNIDLIKERIKIQERMNEDGNKKLDNMLPILLGIPGLITAVPTKTDRLISPKIPTIEQITKNTPTPTCRFTEDGIKKHVTSDGTFSRARNETYHIAELAIAVNTNNLAKTADKKLGGQLNGGLSQKLLQGFAWLQLDRALNMLTFAATVQNHLMLSRDIGTTLLGAFSNVLTLIGIKDDSGQPLNIGNIINLTIENLVKGIVGAENYVVLSENLAKANRIYQSATNVLNSFQNISNTILTGMELIGSYTGKIGNALKKSGEVLENAYGWMNPQPKFNRITQGLENLQQGASTIQQVTQAPLDVVNAVTELQTANTELIKAIKEDNKPENKAPEIPEPDKLKADELASKIRSTVSNILPDDLFNAAD